MWNLCISFNWYRLLSVFHLMKSTFFSSFCSWYLSFLILKCESKHGARISYLCESANITTCVGSVFVPENITFYPTKSELAQIIRCRNKISKTDSRQFKWNWKTVASHCLHLTAHQLCCRRPASAKASRRVLKRRPRLQVSSQSLMRFAVIMWHSVFPALILNEWNEWLFLTPVLVNFLICFGQRMCHSVKKLGWPTTLAENRQIRRFWPGCIHKCRRQTWVTVRWIFFPLLGHSSGASINHNLYILEWNKILLVMSHV